MQQGKETEQQNQEEEEAAPSSWYINASGKEKIKLAVVPQAFSEVKQKGLPLQGSSLLLMCSLNELAKKEERIQGVEESDGQAGIPEM